MQFYSFLKNIEYILKLFNKDATIKIEESTINQNETQQQALPLFTNQTTNNNGQLGLFAQAVQSEVNKTEITFTSKIITNNSDLEDMIKALSAKKVIAIKIFADYKNSTNATIYGLSFGYNPSFSITEDNNIVTKSNKTDTECFYIPFSHNIESELNIKETFEQLKPLLENNTVKKFVHDLKTNACILNKYNIIFEIEKEMED